MPSADIELVNVSKKFKGEEVLKSINLKVKRGEFLTILGPSGVGKSTLLKIIAGFEQCSNGKVKLGGNDITKYPPHKRNIGMLFQNYALFPHMTVYDNIAFPLKIRQMSKKILEFKVNDILKKVRLSGFERRYPEQLSGGQQQRVALARALVFSPPVLLLDEPMAALDKQLKKHMQVEIKEIQKEIGITTISVTHDQEEALIMSDRICVMQEGKIVQVAEPEEIYKNPKNLFVAQFIGEVNILDGKVLHVNSENILIRIQNNKNITVLAYDKNLKENDEVKILVRPECINIISEEKFDEYKLDAKVDEVIFCGDAIKIRASLNDNKIIQIKKNTDDMRFIKPGDFIKIGWEENDMILL
jgi:spermidine/putrescine ABC transporter ATP-binding subunit